jgi:hypothetical protein
MERVESSVAPVGAPVWYLNWTPVILGALVATALSSILLAFGASLGLGISRPRRHGETRPPRFAVVRSYLILQAAVSFGAGGYIAGRTSAGLVASDVAEIEHRDGLHGLAAWAISVVLGVVLAALLGSATLTRSNANTVSARTSVAEPLLSYEIDRLLRPVRRAPNVDLSQERAEAGRILLTSSSHSGMSSEDRAYLVQLTSANTGLAAPDAERRVDVAVANSQAAISKSRRSSVVLSFSVAAALLLGAVIAWVAAALGGRHRDGAPMPHWMRTDGHQSSYRRKSP